MAPDTAMPTPNPTTPQPVPGPAPDVTPAVAPPPPDTGSAQPGVLAQVSPLLANANAAGQKAAALANTPDAVPPVPHARLLSMVQGLAQGLGAFGTAIATHGKEGGAPEVAQLQREQQQKTIEAQQAATAQKNAQIQQQIMVMDTNQKLAQNIFFMASLPDEIAQSHMKTAEMGQALEAGKVSLATQKFDLFANTGLSPTQIDQVTAGGAVDAKTSGTLMFNANQAYRTASQLLPADNPALVDLKTALDNKAPVADLVIAGRHLQTELAAQEKITQAKTAQAAAVDASPLGDAAAADQNTRTAQRYQVLNPGKPLPDAYKVTGAMTPAQAKRVTDSLKDTEAAQGIAETRALTNAMHEETLAALRGPQGIDPDVQGPAYLDAVAVKDPGQADMIKAYGQGRLVLSPNIARSPQGQALTKQILRAYPQYIAAKAEGYAKQYQEFTSGKTGISINSYKTSTDHLNAMFDNVAGASNVDLNNPASTVHRQLDVDKEYLSSELAKAVGNGSLTEDEKAGMLRAVDGKTLKVETKGTYQDQLKETVKLLKGKLGGFQSQWQSTAVPGSEPPSNLKDAADATQKLAGGAQAPHVIAIGGVNYTYNGSGDTADLKNYTKQ